MRYRRMSKVYFFRITDDSSIYHMIYYAAPVSYCVSITESIHDTVVTVNELWTRLGILIWYGFEMIEVIQTNDADVVQMILLMIMQYVRNAILRTILFKIDSVSVRMS